VRKAHFSGRTSYVRLVSAGTRALVGSAMHPHSDLVLRGLGATAGDFRAQQLTESLAAQADLTLTMTRAHRREVLRLAPRGLARTFTLREAADLLRLLGEWEPDGDRSGERARSLVKALADARPRHTADDNDDVPDPISGPVEAHEESGELIVSTLLPLLARIAAMVQAGDAAAWPRGAESARSVRRPAALGAQHEGPSPQEGRAGPGGRVSSAGDQRR
jgi:protein-tyrosine-phosphatase